MALAACLLGYGEVGLWLKKQALKPDSWVKLEGNPYLQWIDDYSGEDYQASVKLGIGEFHPSENILHSDLKRRS
jgi:hydroxymethylpyrimidine/phosphomethylpyrimidine kinase / thiaminase